MTDTQWLLIGILVVVILLIFMFRGSLKLGLEALGIKFNAEAANPPKTAPAEPPMKATPGQGDMITASGPRFVAVKDARDAVITTGDGNKIAPPPKPKKP